jgi:hypothetical protein
MVDPKLRKMTLNSNINVLSPIENIATTTTNNYM